MKTLRYLLPLTILTSILSCNKSTLEIPIIVSPSIDSNKMVLIGNNAGKFYAINANTGQQIWEANTGGQIYGSATGNSNTVFVGSFDRKLYAFDLATGATKWTYTTEGAIYGSPVYFRNQIFVASAAPTRKFYCIDAATGLKKWEYVPLNANAGGAQSPAIDSINNTVYFDGGDDFSIYAIDLVTGLKKWEYATASWIGGVAQTNNTVFICSTDGYVYAINALSGILKWRSVNLGVNFGDPSISGNKLVAGSITSGQYSLDINTGAVIWKNSSNGDSSPFIVDSIVYYGSGTTVTAVTLNAGIEKWKVTTGGSNISSPVVNNGILYIGNQDNKLYAIDAITGVMKWSFLTNAPITQPSAIILTQSGKCIHSSLSGVVN